MTAKRRPRTYLEELVWNARLHDETQAVMLARLDKFPGATPLMAAMRAKALRLWAQAEAGASPFTR